mgnify:CR=1 FL=1
MKEIPVFGGLVALVDDKKFWLASQYLWNRHVVRGRRTIYAQAYVKGSKPKRYVYLHRLVLDAPPGVQVDHKDGDGLNCQLDNLRFATHGQNIQNAPKRRTCNGIPASSRFKGVNWNRASKAWIARGWLEGKDVHLGCFKDELEAAIIYNSFAAEHYGEFARLNEIVVTS